MRISDWSSDVCSSDLLPVTTPTLVERYGDAQLQFGELRVPQGKGPFPVAVMIHGGCWLEKFADLRNLAPVASDLPKIGIDTWNIEYRRNDHRGGWLATVTDLGSAGDQHRPPSVRQDGVSGKVVAVGGELRVNRI